MSDIDFNDIANMAVNDIHEPVPHPPGAWRGRINSGKYQEVESDNPKAPLARGVWSIATLEAVEVPEALMDGFDIDNADPLYHDIPVFDRRGNWNIKRFLVGLGALEADDPSPIKEKCGAATGFMVTFTTTQRKNPNAKNGGAPILVDVSDIAAG